MERFNSHRSRQLFADVAHFTAYALKLPPETVLQMTNEWRSTYSGEAHLSTPALAGMAIDSLIDPEVPLDPTAGQLFFVAALEDIASIIDTMKAKYPGLSDDEILTAMSHPTTIDTIALLALRPGTGMHTYINYRLEDDGVLSDDYAYHLENASLAIGVDGCPAAGHSHASAQSSVVRPLPIFKQIIPWATQLHLLSDEWQQSKRATMPLTLEK